VVLLKKQNIFEKYSSSWKMRKKRRAGAQRHGLTDFDMARS
jgi:hypothetical protein